MKISLTDAQLVDLGWELIKNQDRSIPPSNCYDVAKKMFGHEVVYDELDFAQKLVEVANVSGCIKCERWNFADCLYGKENFLMCISCIKEVNNAT